MWYSGISGGSNGGGEGGDSVEAVMVTVMVLDTVVEVEVGQCWRCRKH